MPVHASRSSCGQGARQRWSLRRPTLLRPCADEHCQAQGSCAALFLEIRDVAGVRSLGCVHHGPRLLVTATRQFGVDVDHRLERLALPSFSSTAFCSASKEKKQGSAESHGPILASLQALGTEGGSLGRSRRTRRGRLDENQDEARFRQKSQPQCPEFSAAPCLRHWCDKRKRPVSSRRCPLPSRSRHA
jgi:hypothetical protein